MADTTNPIGEKQIQSVFISAVLRDTAELIHRKQNEVVDTWDLFESGELKRSLQGHFSIDAQDGSGHLSMRYLSYIRWLDMQDSRRQAKKEGYHLYNRIVFGVLYNPTMNALMYGLTEDVKTFLGDKLKEAFESNKPHYKIGNTIIDMMSDYDRNYAALMSKSQRMGYK